MSLAGKRSLYICYFWIREPLVQTQVIPYLRELTKAGMEVTLLTFEPGGDALSEAEAREERDRLAAMGIDWQSLTYHKTPTVPATFYDIMHGTLSVRRLIRERAVDVVHCRVHVPAVMGALARLLSGRKPKLLFDIRGFFPEEYTDAGVWSENGVLYKTTKAVERWLLRESDGFVVLTEKAREILFPESSATGFDVQHRPVEVIPCCVDITRFADRDHEAAQIRRLIGAADRPIMAYVGALGGWYLTDDMMRLFSAARRVDPRFFALILTKKDHKSVKRRLIDVGYGEGDMYVAGVSPTDLPPYLEASDIGVSLIKACYSKQSSSPTKIAEYLAAGLTVIANPGVGDVDLTLSTDETGVLLSDFSDDAMSSAVVEALRLVDDRQRKRNRALEEFDLERVGGPRYRRIYSRLLEVDV